ncbi:MAG: hypothetical protein AB7G80_03035 [Dongiaceae bacterium]
MRYFVLAVLIWVGVAGAAQAQNTVPLNLVSQWQAVDVSIARLISSNYNVVGSEVARIDGGIMVSVTYLQGVNTQNNARQLFRCVEYVREFQFETISTACFIALEPRVNQPARR